MANSVSVPRDLTKVKSKILFGLTKRQLICFSIAAVVGVPAFFLLKKTGNISLAALGMMILMMPMFFIGMYEKNGEPLEVIIIYFIRASFIRPRKRIYQTRNFYAGLEKQAAAEEEVRKIVSKYTVSPETKTGHPASGKHLRSRPARD